MDAIYPGTFNLAKVKWGAKFDYEYLENFKILQNAFDKNAIKKHLDLRADKFRDFILDNMDNIKINGDTIVLS